MLVCMGILASTMGGTRYTRDTRECTQAKTEFDGCTHLAYENYRRAHSKGNEEKKHDWLARNACNFLTESVEICGNMLVGVCNDQTIKKEKDEQLSGVLTQVKKKIPNWDSEKCSVTEKAEVSTGGKQTTEPDEKQKGCATIMPVYVIPSLLLCLFVLI